MTPVYSTASVTETRTVRFTVSGGPLIAHPSFPGRTLTLGTVTVEMERAVKPAPTAPAMKTLEVAGADYHGQRLHGSYAAHQLSVPQTRAGAVPPLVLDLLRVALEGWEGELAKRGVRNQVANVSGGGFAIQADTINGTVNLPGLPSGRWPFS